MSSAKLHSKPGNEHLSQQVIRQYLQEDLSAAQMHQVERHLLTCKLCSDAVEGLATAPNANETAAIAQLKWQLNDRIGKKETKTIPFIWKPIGIAATVSILLAVTLLLFTPDTIQETERQAIQKDTQELAQQPAQTQPDTTLALAETPKPVAAPPEDKLAMKPSVSKRNAAPAKEKTKEAFEVEENESLAPDVALDQLEEEIKNKAPLAVVETSEPPRSNTTQPAAPQLKQVPYSARETTGVTQNMITVTGKVVASEDKAPLPGVNVTIKGTNTGTITDAEGKYVLTAPQESTLSFNYIGYKTKELAAENKEAAEVDMEADIQSLSEVVVIGYGTTADSEEKPNEYIKPKPAEGNASFKNYIKNNLKYPSKAKEKQIEGAVKLEFMVETDGRLSDFKVRRSLGYGLDEEAIRLIKEGPAWKPAQVNGKPARRKVTVSIPFKL